MLASLASVSISVTNVLAVETSERLVHRALMARVPEALEATHPHPDATGAVAEFLLRKSVPVARRVMGTGNVNTLRLRWNYAMALYKDPGATLDDLREAVATFEDSERIARRVFGDAHPLTVDIEDSLQKARAVLRAHDATA